MHGYFCHKNTFQLFFIRFLLANPELPPLHECPSDVHSSVWRREELSARANGLWRELFSFPDISIFSSEAQATRCLGWGHLVVWNTTAHTCLLAGMCTHRCRVALDLLSHQRCSLTSPWGQAITFFVLEHAGDLRPILYICFFFSDADQNCFYRCQWSGFI